MDSQSDAAMDRTFNPLAAAEELERSGMDSRQARACAAQMQLAASSGAPVTREQLDSALGKLRAELVECITGTRAESESETGKLRAELVERITGTRAEIESEAGKLRAELVERIIESERRTASLMATLLWRLFGGLVALAGLVVAGLRYLP